MISASDLNTTQSQPVQLHNTNIPTPHTQMPPSRPNQTFEPTLDRPVAIVTSLQVASFNDEDDAIDIDQLAAIEAQMSENPGKRYLNEGTSNPEKKLKLNKTSSVTETSKITPLAPTNRFDDYPDDNIFIEEDEDYLRELEADIDAKQNKLYSNTHKVKNVSPEPFVYIKQINEMADSEKAGRVYKVKAQIMKLLSKLAVGKDGWSLKCNIVDGSGSLDVDFTSDVLSKLFGFTPQEMNQLKKEMATKPEIKAQVGAVSII